MALPKLETKTYTLTLPSTGEDIKYRPFLVKEQKTLMMAQESKSDTEIIDAMNQLISQCTFGKVNPKTCPMFDAEYIFLKLRAKSVGETAQVQVTCPDDEKTKVNVVVNLNEIECTMTDDHTNEIQITDRVKIIFNYPLISSFKNTKEDNQTEYMFNIISDSISEIHFDGKVFNKVDMSKKEITEFIESLTTEQFEDISKFFETMPKLRHVVEVTNPETKVKSEVVIQGLQSFLV
tara:strand:- start:1182 stop:1886 length:705 start_codon:yes stop_codon:yes gene_type:complete